MLELTITQNTKKKEKKREEKYHLVIFPWSIISVKKANVVSVVTKREKCFDRWEAGSVEIN